MEKLSCLRIFSIGTNMLKQAMERRANSCLPSNFNYQMMNKIRLEAVKQHRRRKVVSWCWLIAGALSLLGLGAYMLVAYMKVDLMEYMLREESIQPSTDLIAICWYIAVLVLILLGLDHWMRWYRRKTLDK